MTWRSLCAFRRNCNWSPGAFPCPGASCLAAGPPSSSFSPLPSLPFVLPPALVQQLWHTLRLPVSLDAPLDGLLLLFAVHMLSLHPAPMETPLAVQRRPRLACPPDLSAWANAGLGLSTKPISRPLDVDERSVRSPSSSTVQRFPRAGSPPGSIAPIKRRDCSTSNDDDRERFEAWLERSSALETFALDGDAAGRQETGASRSSKLSIRCETFHSPR